MRLTKNHFKSLCSTLDLNVLSFTVTRIGKKIEGKSRVLLVQLPDLATKHLILSQSAQLRSKTTWKKVYVNPDLTRYERETQRLLRDELKARKEKGETDLIIRGNRIVKRRGTKNVGQSPSSLHTTASTVLLISPWRVMKITPLLDSYLSTAIESTLSDDTNRTQNSDFLPNYLFRNSREQAETDSFK